MITSPSEKIERNKAVRHLIATWKKNDEIRNKALLLMQLNPETKIKKNDRPFIPGTPVDFSKFR